MYLKITKYAIGTSISRYSCQCRRRLRFHLAPTVCRLTPADAGSATVTSNVCGGPIASLPTGCVNKRLSKCNHRQGSAVKMLSTRIRKASAASTRSRTLTSRLRDISELITTNNVTTIYFEVLTGPQVTRALADDLNITTAILDPIENQKPQAWNDTMNANLQALAARGLPTLRRREVPTVGWFGFGG